MSQYTTLASWTLAIVKALTRAGIDAVTLLEESEIDLEDIKQHPEARIEITKMTQLWHLAEAATNNPAFGLAVGKCVNPLHFRALGMLIMSCQNLAEAFNKISEFYSAVSNTAEVRLDRTPDKIGFVIQPLEGVEVSTLAIDAFYSSIIELCDQVLNDRSFVASLELTRAQPEFSKPWKDSFGEKVTFEAQQNCLWMHRQHLEDNQVLSNPTLAMHSESAVKAYIQSFEISPWSKKVLQIIQQELVTGEPSLNTVSQTLGISSKTLSRKLKDEGAKYRDLLEQKRKELSVLYLRESDLALTEVAYRLGFSDVSNFNRAFKRWFGETPTEHRTGSASQ